MSLLPWKKTQPTSQIWPIQQDVQRMFDRFLAGFPALPSLSGLGMMEAIGPFPAVNVRDMGTTVEVQAEVPGLTADDLDVHVDGNVLMIKGEKRDEKKEQTGGYYHLERSFGSFVRRVELPGPVDANAAEADLKNGVLNLRLPKLPGEAGKVIKIKGATLKGSARAAS